MLPHPWNLSPAEAVRLQEELRPRVIDEDRLGRVRRVAGADVAYEDERPGLVAAVAVLDAGSLEVLEVATARGRAQFPYVPGLFSFREVPPLLDAFSKLSGAPDLVLCDGHGRAHPRRFGLACHLGLLLDMPTIGCAKSRLIGIHGEPGLRRGSHAALRDRAEVIGEVVRTRDGVRPLYVSVGHRVSLRTARLWVLRLAPRYRLPEPIRAAHREVTRLLAIDPRRPRGYK